MKILELTSVGDLIAHTSGIVNPSILLELLHYDVVTGELFWRDRDVKFFKDGGYSSVRCCHMWNAKWSGKLAFTTNDGGGYYQGRIFGRMYFAHRVIWAMETGEWPKDQIDHIDHDRANNRMENLREATNQQNQRNTRISKNNTSGIVGVSWNKTTSKWRAYIRCDGRREHLGYFACKSEAIAARTSANIKCEYHPNHGQIVQ